MPRAIKSAASAKASSNVIDWACAEQEELFDAAPRPILASGGFNSGKTVAAFLKLLFLADTFPGYRVVVARRFYSELKQTTMQTFFKLCPPEAYAKGNKNESGGVGTVTLNNGSRFSFMHLDRPDATSVIRGLEINGMLLDQAEEMQEEVFDMLESRLGRWDKVEVPKEMVKLTESLSQKPWSHKSSDGRNLPPNATILTCNPDLEDHWLWRRFHPDSQEWREKWADMGYRMITFDTLNNKFASKENIAIMESKDEAFKKRFMHGEWGNAEGVIFHMDAMSIIEPTDDLLGYIRSACRLFRILDHGDGGITCCLWMAVDKEGNIYFYRELYFSGNVRQTRDAIFELSKKDYVRDTPPQYTDIADPSIFNLVARRVGGRDVINRWAVADEYLDTTNYDKETSIYWTPADNAEMASRERVNDYLRVDPLRMHPIKRERESPKLFFLKRTTEYEHGCQYAITQVRSARRLQIGSANGKPIFGDERDETIPDHALDCVRYGVMSRPAPAATKQRTFGRMTWDGYSKLTRDMRRMSRAKKASWS